MTDMTKNSPFLQEERSAFEAAYAAEFSNARVQVYTANDIASMREGDGYGERPYLNGQWKGWQARAALVLVDTPTPPEALATKLIDTWCATHGGQIPWEKAVEITAIATSMGSEERERLLAMADEDAPAAQSGQAKKWTYASEQETNCAGCGVRKHTPLRVDWMGGYVCLTCIDAKLEELYEALPDAQAGQVPAQARTKAMQLRVFLGKAGFADQALIADELMDLLAAEPAQGGAS